MNHTAEIGGPSHSLHTLVRHLRDTYDCVVLLPEDGRLRDLLKGDGISTFVIPALRSRKIFSILQLLRQERIDLVYGNSPSSCSRNAMLAAKLARKPFIWHFRSTKWHWTWHKAFFLRWADQLVAVSQACAESLRRFYPRDIHVIHNGVELADFVGDRTEARKYLADLVSLSPLAPCLISVSVLVHRKGHEHAVAAIAHLIKEIPNAHLVVAGMLDRDPSYTSEIRAKIRRQGLDGHVHLLGLRTDVARLLLGSDVFLHSATRDPHPRAVIEAMAAGLPVVAFAVDGVAETIVDGETGYLIERGDATGMATAAHNLLADPAKASEMGRSGQERVRRHFTSARTATRIGHVIDSLL